MDVKTILKQHWGPWAVDDGSRRQTCGSAEKFYVDDESRFRWPADRLSVQRRLSRYCARTAERAERIISFHLPAQEKKLLRVMYIDHPGAEAFKMAEVLGIGLRQFDTICLAAHVRFGRLWRGEGGEAS